MCVQDTKKYTTAKGFIAEVLKRTVSASSLIIGETLFFLKEKKLNKKYK